MKPDKTVHSSGSATIPDESKRIARQAQWLFFLCFAAYSFSYIGRKNFSVCLPAMILDGTLDKVTGGYITTAYMIFYAAGQLVHGMAAARMKPHYLVSAGLLGAGLVNIGMGFSSKPWMMIVLWSLNGCFHSMLWAPIIRIFTDRLPASRRYAAGVNISVALPVGTIFSYLLSAWLLKAADWHVVFFACGGLLLLAFSVWVIGHIALRRYIAFMDEACEKERARLREEEEGKTAKRPESPSTPVKVSFPKVIFHSGLLLILLMLFCNGALKDSVIDWAPTFFTEQFRLSESAAALISVLIPIVTVPGAYVATWLNKRFCRKNEVFATGILFLVAFLCIIGVRMSGTNYVILSAVCLSVGISAMMGANTLLLTLLPYHFASLGMSSSVTGFLNSSAYVASAISSALYGLIAEHTSWNTLMLLWLGIGAVGFIVSLPIGKVWAKKSARLDKGHL